MSTKLYNAYRRGERAKRAAQFVADCGQDASPRWAPYYAYPWTTAPTEIDKGAFGADSTGLLYGANSAETAFLPVVGNRKVLRASVTGAYALLASDSGAFVYWDQAAGITFTLPAPKLGMWFDFYVTVTATSAAHKVITDSASTFLLGVFAQSTDGTYTETRHLANGTTIRAWSGNGTTTGGVQGDTLRIAAASTTVWMVTGRGSATGVEATPFATS